MKIVLALASLGLLACCGDNDHPGTTDAPPIDAVDAAPDAFVDCNYNEQHDTTNDYLAVPNAIEESGIMFKSGETRTICGTVNIGHFDAGQGSIDIDNFGVTFANDADVVVRLTGNAQNLNSVGVFSVNDAGDATGGNFYLGNHAVFSHHFTAGHYQFSVEAYGDADATAAVPYKVRITTDNPTMRCPDVTAAASYTEAADGATNDGNDVVAIDYSANPFIVLTAAADAPEPTNLVLAPGNYRITGNSASVAGSGSYFDRDDYLVTSGPTTNELAIRLKPGSAQANMDYFLFEENRVTVLNEFASASAPIGQEEFATFAVNPNSKYWLWIGKANADSANVATTYDASVCAVSIP